LPHRRTFATIQAELYRYPAVDPAAFQRAIDRALAADEGRAH
jgi:hypothetical protein